MRSLSAIALALCAGQTIAHADIGGDLPIPKLAGARRFLNGFKGERRWDHGVRSAPTARSRERRHADSLEERGDIEERQNTNGRCGSRYGSCATGYCCSFEGYCGLGADYCESPDCQLNYGTGCDGNQKPSGVDTSTIPRTKVGKIAYGGVGIYDCVNDGDIAVTFDDGPWNYTNDLLDKLASYQAKATFFITGTNLHKGMINDPKTPWPSVIQRMAAEGHQIASHTWSHENFSQLTTTQFQNQIYWNEIAFNDILGYFPTYMRPPYSICPTNTCGSQLATLGYHVVYFDLDTEGYLNDDPIDIQTSKDIWDDTVPGTNPCRSNFLQIEHDIHYQTVYNLTDYVLTSLFKSGYRSVTLYIHYSCADWHVVLLDTNIDTDDDRPSGTNEHVDSCSVNGYCGSSIDYCGAGCNPQFGSCSTGDDPLPRSIRLLWKHLGLLLAWLPAGIWQRVPGFGNHHNHYYFIVDNSHFYVDNSYFHINIAQH
ncbi:hypothetical protein ONZ43_g5676 [Nemania bipapillata]|uniref:Uncharacterized protein n=1 Tax=Nemania bipapillata TaxID=110536 RepID=A0ACC2I7S4_9PEZI|nr:hypothetical protein ONZ43_g5676 [Nemania bipapillata]